MKRLLTIAALTMAGAAGAQVLGGGVAGTVGGATGSVAAGAQTGIDATRALDGANSTIRAVDESARESARAASDRASRAKPGKRVDVRTGAAVQVSEGSRCYDGYRYDDARYYGPTYRDGSYYCERRTGPGVAVGAEAKVGG